VHRWDNSYAQVSATADTIGEVIQKGADPRAAIGAVVVTASDFAQLMFGEGARDDLIETLNMQRGKKLPAP
jgi:hypothetical protein